MPVGEVRRMIAVACGLLSGGLPCIPSHAQSPEIVAYQGVLAYADGSLVHHESQAFDLTFRIFDHESGGTLRFEQRLPVLVRQGQYQVLLSGAGLTDAFAAGAAWIGVTIEAGPGISAPVPLAPRQRVTSVPYALSARLGDGPPGPQGAHGPAGTGGDVGPQGVAGPQGPRGAQGIQGIPGDKGSTGSDGTDGQPAPPAKTVAICWEGLTARSCSSMCGSASKVKFADQTFPCEVYSESGYCDGGWQNVACCECRP